MAKLLKAGTLGTTPDAELHTFNAGAEFGVESGGKVLGDADATDVKYSIFEDGVLLVNESGTTRTVNVKLQNAAGAVSRMGPQSLQLGDKYVAFVTRLGIQVWNQSGELQTTGAGGGGVAQTPWTSDIAAAGFKLRDVSGDNFLLLNDSGNISLTTVGGRIGLTATIDTDGVAIIDPTGTNDPIKLLNPGSGGYNGAWIDMPSNVGAGPAGIGTGGPGANAWIANVVAGGQWFDDAVSGDIAYRNTIGRLLFGAASGDANLTIDSSGCLFVNASVDDGTTSALQVDGDVSVTGNFWAQGSQGYSGDLTLLSGDVLHLAGGLLIGAN